MRKAFFLIILAISTLGARAQYLTQSPYSRYGVGELQFQGFADQHATGQTGIAERSSLRYSLANPASYSALRMTNFRFGGSGYMGKMQDNQNSLRVNHFSYAYLTVGFQIDKKKTWGVVMGFTPFSTTGYNIEFNDSNQQGNHTKQFAGAGGLSRYFVGTGKRFGDHLSIGVQGSFLMGITDISETLIFPNDGTTLSYKENSTNYLHGFYVEGGAHWEQDQSYRRYVNRVDSTDPTNIIQRRDTVYKKVKHVFGLTYQSSGTIKGRQDFFARTVHIIGPQVFTRDTILFSTIEGKMVIPTSIGFGYNLSDHGGKWRVGVEYRQNMWSQFTSDFNSFKLVNSFQASAGFAWRPTTNMEQNKKTFGERTAYLFKKSEYRFGVRHNSGIVSLSGQNIAESGVSFGMGIPLRIRTVNEEFKYENVFSSLDFSLEYYQRGTLANNLIKENYFRFVIGVSLNDKWFNKRKIE